MSNKPLVSIGIPTYNQESYIEKAVHSALKQSYEHLEIVVVDDCSSDDTHDVLSDILSRHDKENLRILKNSQNIGPHKNYQRILNICNGKWLIMLDGDDYFIENNYIKHAMEMIENNKDVALVCAEEIINFGYTSKIKNLSNKTFKQEGKDSVLNLLKNGRGIEHTTSLYRVSIAKEVNAYEYPIPSSDQEALYKIATTGNVIRIHRPVSVNRIVGTSVSMSATSADILIEDLKYLKRLEQFLYEKEGAISNDIKNAIHSREHRKIIQFLVKMNLFDDECGRDKILNYANRRGHSTKKVLWDAKVILSRFPLLYKYLRHIKRCLGS